MAHGGTIVDSAVDPTIDSAVNSTVEPAVESTVESTVRPALESMMEPVEHLGTGRSIGALRSVTLGHALRESTLSQIKQRR